MFGFFKRKENKFKYSLSIKKDRSPYDAKGFYDIDSVYDAINKSIIKLLLDGYMIKASGTEYFPFQQTEILSINLKKDGEDGVIIQYLITVL